MLKPPQLLASSANATSLMAPPANTTTVGGGGGVAAGQPHTLQQPASERNGSYFAAGNYVTKPHHTHSPSPTSSHNPSSSTPLSMDASARVVLDHTPHKYLGPAAGLHRTIGTVAEEDNHSNPTRGTSPPAPTTGAGAGASVGAGAGASVGAGVGADSTMGRKHAHPSPRTTNATPATNRLFTSGSHSTTNTTAFTSAQMKPKRTVLVVFGRMRGLRSAVEIHGCYSVTLSNMFAPIPCLLEFILLQQS
jgi:hypothetical protein